MAIPIYNPQVAPPHKPSRRGIAGAEARAAGQLAAGVEQIGTTFAGKLFDLANTNQINESMVTARQRFRSFWGELQRDPDYARYGEKFENFFSDLREEVEKTAKLPRARREAEIQLKNLRQDWIDAISKFSDERTIEHTRTVRLQGINQGIRDLDIDRVLAQLRESAQAMEFTAPDQVKIEDTAIPEVIEAKTMAFARILGDQGMLWLMSEEAEKAYEVQVSPEKHYFLDPEKRQQMAIQLGNELTNRRKAEETADWNRKRLVLDFAQDEIISGRLTNVDQLEGQDYQEQFQQKHGRDMGLMPEDREKIRQILANRAEAAEKDREAYSNDLLGVVDDALKVGDTATASVTLQELIEGGYAIDRMGRMDPDIRRRREQLQRLVEGGEITDFDRESNRLWGRLRDQRLSGMREELGAFLEQFPTKEGREEHKQLLNELQQAEQQVEARAAKGRTKSNEQLQAEYYTYFSGIIDNPNITTTELTRLEQWRYRNYPRNERNKELPGIEQTTFQQMGQLINNKREELGKATDLRREQLKMAEDRIRIFYEPQIKELEKNTRKRPTQELFRLMGERDRMLLTLQSAAKDPKTDLLQQAMILLAEPKRGRVKGLLKALDIREPAATPAAAAPENEQQLRQRFRDAKGEPIKIDRVNGKPAFFDGHYWWIFEEQVWKFWDGKKWAIDTKSLMK